MRRISKYDILYGIAAELVKAALILVAAVVLVWAIGWLWSGGRVD
jgi:hypothetical protein